LLSLVGEDVQLFVAAEDAFRELILSSVDAYWAAIAVTLASLQNFDAHPSPCFLKSGKQSELRVNFPKVMDANCGMWVLCKENGTLSGSQVT
jgi:hypothetical protein